MDNKINHFDLAVYCRDEFRQKHTGDNKAYVGTTFISIYSDGTIRSSVTPHILMGAQQSILLHEYSELAITNWYSWYKIQYIDNEGQVRDNSLCDGFDLLVVAAGSFSNQTLELRKDNNTIYWTNRQNEWVDQMPMIWALYEKCRSCDSIKEMQLLGQLAKTEQELIKSKQEIKGLELQNVILQKEVKHYDGLLQKIEKLVDDVN